MQLADHDGDEDVVSADGESEDWRLLSRRWMQPWDREEGRKRKGLECIAMLSIGRMRLTKRFVT